MNYQSLKENLLLENELGPPLSLDEIELYEKTYELSFPYQYKKFQMNFSYAYSKSVGTFFLDDGTVVYGCDSFTSILANGGDSLINQYLEWNICMEDYQKFYHFGSSAFSTKQYFFIGIKEPFIGKIFLWNWQEDKGTCDEAIEDENGMMVYPKHFVADSFDEFLEILINNLDNPRIGE